MTWEAKVAKTGLWCGTHRGDSIPRSENNPTLETESPLSHTKAGTVKNLNCIPCTDMKGDWPAFVTFSGGLVNKWEILLFPFFSQDCIQWETAPSFHDSLLFTFSASPHAPLSTVETSEWPKQEISWALWVQSKWKVGSHRAGRSYIQINGSQSFTSPWEGHEKVNVRLCTEGEPCFWSFLGQKDHGPEYVHGPLATTKEVCYRVL